MQFSYPHKKILDKNKKNIMINENTTFFICIFTKTFEKNVTSFPIIRYLLYKQKLGGKNIVSFPYTHFNKNLKTTLSDVEDLVPKEATFEGFKTNGDDFYMFYSIEDNTVNHIYNDKVLLYWTTIYEIVNRQKIADLDVHFATSAIFYNNIRLCYCFSRNKAIEFPMVVLCDMEKQSFLEIMQQFEQGQYFIENNEEINFKNKFIRINIFDYKIKNNKIYYDKINHNILSIHN